MGLYIVYTSDIDNRKTDHLFSFRNDGCWLNKEPIFPVEGNVLDAYKQITAYSFDKKIDSYEIVIGKDNLVDILSYLSNYLSDKDINIGLITNNRNYIKKNEIILNLYGVTYSLQHKVKKERVINKTFFSMATLDVVYPQMNVARAKSPLPKSNSIKLDESFHDKFMKLLIESGKDNVEVYKASGVSRQVFSKIISDKDMIPTKLTLMSLCIGLELPLFVAKQLMESAGYSLSRSLLLDSIVMKYLKDEVYDFSLINSELNENGCQLLGWHPREN